ncbi:MAG: glyoxalase [Acidobacteriales bacterium 13_2_20CM_2_55_5]|nr:MAG: glyoxalase [Acidobacteriales bacterium 13_2_20CM_2_55_5]
MIDPQKTPPFTINPQARIGHVHLKVADLQRALNFYSGVLGFEVMQRYGEGAVFLSAGGYHHHIALNTWEGRGGSPPPPGRTGLYHTAILYPTNLRDPDDNGVELYCDKPEKVWPRTADGKLAMTTESLDVHRLLSEAPPGIELDSGPRDL